MPRLIEYYLGESESHGWPTEEHGISGRSHDPALSLIQRMSWMMHRTGDLSERENIAGFVWDMFASETPRHSLCRIRTVRIGLTVAQLVNLTSGLARQVCPECES